MKDKEHLKLVEPACTSQYNFIGWLAFIGGLLFFSGILWAFIDMYTMLSGKETAEPYIWAGVIFLAGGTAYFLAYMEMDTGNAIVATQNKINFGSIFVAFLISSVILFFGIHLFFSNFAVELMSNIDKDRTVLELSKQIKNETSEKRKRTLKTAKLQRVKMLQDQLENRSFMFAGLLALFGLILRITYAFSYMTKDEIKIPFLRKREKLEESVTQYLHQRPQNNNTEFKSLTPIPKDRNDIIVSLVDEILEESGSDTRKIPTREKVKIKANEKGYSYSGDRHRAFKESEMVDEHGMVA